MKNTAQKLIFISFVLALIAAAAVFLYLNSLKSPDKETKKTTVLVAADTIPPRTLIDKKMIKEMELPDNSILGDYIKDHSKIIGKYSRETIYKNEGFLADKLLDNDANELSLKISSNYRAISINATGDSGVADLLKPGDYVDLIAYIVEKKDGATVVVPDIAKIILQDIEVLAVDKQLNREDKTTDKIKDTEKKLANFLVTLSVPASELEKVVLAESIGSIKLALRPLKDDDTTQTKGTTMEELIINSNSKDAMPSKQQDNARSISSGNTGSSNNENYISYTVKRGDTLEKLSKEFYGDRKKYTIIMEANNIQDKDVILIGKVIKIPILQ